MKPDQLYQHLKDLADRLDIHVSEQNLNTLRPKVKSGLCKVKGKHRFIMDKHAKLNDKIESLADCLGRFPVDDIYVIPAVRDLLEKYRGRPADTTIEHTPSADLNG